MGNPTGAIPSLDTSATVKSTVDKLPTQSGSSIEFSPTHDQGIVGSSAFGGNTSGFPGNLQPAQRADNSALVHDFDQEINMFLGEVCKKFDLTPRSAMFHIRNCVTRLYTQVYS